MPLIKEGGSEGSGGSLRRTVLWMTLLQSASTPIMLSAVNVALPRIGRELALDAVQIAWVPMMYLAASAMVTLICGRLADMFGRKRIFLLGCVCVIASSVFASAADSAWMLLLGRLLQGISVGLLYATQISIVTSVFPPSERGRIIGLNIAVIYIGLSVGAGLGGLITDLLGWRAVFYLHVPPTLAVLLIGLLGVPKDWKAEHPGRFDFIGALLYAAGIASVCAAVAFMPSVASGALLLIGVILAVVFFAVERRCPSPLLDVRLFLSNHVFLYSNLASWLNYSATYANVALISLYLQVLRDVDASMAGLVLMTQPTTMCLLAPLSGRLSDRIEPRLVASMGLAITCIGLVVLACLSEDASFSRVVLGLFLTGCGISMFAPPNTNAIMGSVDRKFLGVASASVSTVRLLGQLCSMGVVAVAFSLVIGRAALGDETHAALASAISICFAFAAALCIPALLFSLKRGKVHGLRETVN
ncbi:MAG: MFS transporter [Candidatus Eutrophobiaceae bacterium]